MKKILLIGISLLILCTLVFAGGMQMVQVNSDAPVIFYLTSQTEGGSGVGNYSYQPQLQSDNFIAGGLYTLEITSIKGQKWAKTITLANDTNTVTLITKSGDSLSVSYCLVGNCPETTSGKYNIEIKKGWNIVPYAILSFLPPECITAGAAAYYYSPIANKYAGPIIIGQYGQKFPGYEDAMRDANNNYYQSTNALGAAWLYSNSDCTVSARYNEYLTYSNQGSAYPQSMFNLTQDYLNKFKILAGWNFMTVSPWMMGKSIKNIFSNCTISAFNGWDSTQQKWFYSSSSAQASVAQQSTALVIEGDLGKTFVVKMAADCFASLATPPQVPTSPPALP